MKSTFSKGILAIAVGLAIFACGPSAKEGEKASGDASKTETAQAAPTSGLAGSITIDGSSTVGPVTTAVVEDFGNVNKEVKISVSEKGTGAGIKAFIAKEIDICDASRAIKDEEIADATKAGVEFVEIPIAYDGLSIIVNPKNDFAKDLTVEELKKIWEPGSKITNWKDVRAGFPDKPLKLFGPTTSHGTFEYFTEAICKTKKKSREDYQQCPDYNALIQGVSGEEGALGYVGFNYYEQNKTKVKLVGVNAGKGAIEPNPERIINGEYSPLARPLLIYVSKKSLERKEVSEFVKFYLTEGKKAISETGYVPLPDDGYKFGLDRVEKGITGSVFNKFTPGTKLADFLKSVEAAAAK